MAAPERAAPRPPEGDRGALQGGLPDPSCTERSAGIGVRQHGLTGVPVEALLARLDLLDAEPSINGEGRIRARCPVHGGARLDSLAIDPTEDGRRWLACCHAEGCSQAEVVEALLARGPLERVSGPVAGVIPAHVRGGGNAGRPPLRREARTYRELREAHERLLAKPDMLARLDAERAITRDVVELAHLGWHGDRITVPYRSPMLTDRMAVYAVERWRPSWLRREGELKLLAESGQSRWLYWPTPPTDSRAVLCEGPMDALAGRCIGLPTVAAPSCRWTRAWTEELLALGIASVDIPHDRDEEGEHFAAEVYAALRAAGIAVTTVALPFPMGTGADLTDYVRSAR